MANTSPKTFAGAWDTTYGDYRAKIKCTWPTIPTGATSVQVTFTAQFECTSALWSSSNHFDMTCAGYSNDSDFALGTSSTNKFGPGTKDVFSFTRTVTISTTATTNVSVSGTISGVYGVSNLTVSGTLVLPASGVAFAHPTITANTLDFTANRNVSFTATNGVAWSTSQVAVKVYTGRNGTTQSPIATITVAGASVTNVGSTYYVPLSAQNVTDILNYWNATAHENTWIGLTVTTTDGGTNTQVHPEVYVVPLAVSACYSITGFQVSRGPASGGNTTPQTLIATIQAAAGCPQAQANDWPIQTNEHLVVNFKRGTTLVSGTVTIQVNGYTATCSISDATAISEGATQAFTAYLYQLPSSHVLGSAFASKAFTLEASQSFIALRYVSDTDQRVGINNGNPTCALDVTGDIKATSIAGDIKPNALVGFASGRGTIDITTLNAGASGLFPANHYYNSLVVNFPAGRFTAGQTPVVVVTLERSTPAGALLSVDTITSTSFTLRARMTSSNTGVGFMWTATVL